MRMAMVMQKTNLKHVKIRYLRLYVFFIQLLYKVLTFVISTRRLLFSRNTSSCAEGTSRVLSYSFHSLSIFISLRGHFFLKHTFYTKRRVSLNVKYAYEIRLKTRMYAGLPCLQGQLTILVIRRNISIRCCSNDILCIVRSIYC